MSAIFATIRSKPRGSGRGVCTACVNSKWLEMGWPAGYQEWAKDETGDFDRKGIYVAVIESPIGEPKLELARRFFEDPTGPKDADDRHDHKALVRHLIAGAAQSIVLATKAAMQKERSDEHGEWLTRAERLAIVEGELARAAEWAKREA